MNVLLFCLPEEVLSTWILSKISLVDVARLEQAATERNLHRKLQKLFATCAWCHIDPPPITPTLLQWLNRRNIMLRSMIYTNDISDADFGETLCSTGKLVSVEFHKNDQVTDCALTLLLQRSPSLRRLTICGCEQLNDSSPPNIAAWCTNLQYLRLNMRILTNNGVIPILMHARDLRYLHLNSNFHLTDETAVCIGLHCTKLIYLSLRGNYVLSDVGIRAIAAGCGCLQALDLPGSTFITDHAIVAVAIGCPLLVELNCDIITTLTDVSIIALAQHCPHVQRLQLAGCQLITDAGLTALAHGCKELRHLKIPFLYRITDAALEAMAENCTNLRTLHAVSCRLTTKRYIHKLAEYCTHLELLSVEKLDQNDSIRDEIVRVFTSARDGKVTVTVSNVSNFHGQTDFAFVYG